MSDPWLQMPLRSASTVSSLAAISGMRTPAQRSSTAFGHAGGARRHELPERRDAKIDESPLAGGIAPPAVGVGHEVDRFRGAAAVAEGVRLGEHRARRVARRHARPADRGRRRSLKRTTASSSRRRRIYLSRSSTASPGSSTSRDRNDVTLTVRRDAFVLPPADLVVGPRPRTHS